MRYHVGLCVSFIWLLACQERSAAPRPEPALALEPAAEESVEVLDAPAPLRVAAAPEEAHRLRAAASRARRSGQLEQARTLLEQACAMEDAPSCLWLAELLEAGEGGQTDPERARELFEMACASGLSEACDTLGH